MPIQNKYLIENKKPVELIQELKDYEIKKSPLSPTARVKVISKSGSGYVSEDRERYGPCPSGCYQRTRDGCIENVYYQTPNTSGTSSDYGKYCSCASSSRFCLKVQCYNWLGDGGSFYACSTANALDCVRALENDKWYSAKVISDEVLLKCATLVREAIRRYDNGYRVKGYVKVEGKFWTGYESSYNY